MFANIVEGDAEFFALDCEDEGVAEEVERDGDAEPREELLRDAAVPGAEAVHSERRHVGRPAQREAAHDGEDEARRALAAPHRSFHVV